MENRWLQIKVGFIPIDKILFNISIIVRLIKNWVLHWILIKNAPKVLFSIFAITTSKQNRKDFINVRNSGKLSDVETCRDSKSKTSCHCLIRIEISTVI